MIGESKARNDLTEDDIAHLEEVQESVRALGVECFIAISNSKEELTNWETVRLRGSADRFLFGLSESDGRGGYVNLPLVLTKATLTVPALDVNHPISKIEPHRASIDELARWTAEHELGLLDGFGDPSTRTLAWRELPS